MHPNLLVSSLPLLALAPARFNVAVEGLAPRDRLSAQTAPSRSAHRRMVMTDAVVNRGFGIAAPFSALIWIGLLYLYFR